MTFSHKKFTDQTDDRMFISDRKKNEHCGQFREKQRSKATRAQRQSLRDQPKTHAVPFLIATPRYTVKEMQDEEGKMIGEREEYLREEEQERKDSEYEDYTYYYRWENLRDGGTRSYPWNWE